MLEVSTNRAVCDVCGSPLRVQRIETRFPVGILLGQPRVHHRIKSCTRCGRTYKSEDLDSLLPPHSNYAYDLIVHVGLARFREHRQAHEIQRELQSRYHIRVPESTVSALASRFLDFFRAVHEANAHVLKDLISAAGGYVLHLDGTCEPQSPVIFVGMDKSTNLVLLSAKMPTENVADITELVRNCVRLFGEPVAVIRDMSRNIELALQAVLPNTPDFICHYHFLLDVGEHLCQKPHAELTRLLRTHKLKASLTAFRKDLVKRIKAGSHIPYAAMQELIDNPLDPGHLKLPKTQIRRCITLMLMRWLNDYVSELRGEYFPLDQPSLEFYRRCVKMHRLLDRLLRFEVQPSQDTQLLHTLRRILAPTCCDKEMLAAARRLQQAVELFHQLRRALRLSPPNATSLVRQYLVADTHEEQDVRENLSEFRKKLQRIMDESPEAERACQARVIIEHLDKYRDKLFVRDATLRDGQTSVFVPRTNNAPEHLFGKTKQGWRRRTGTKKLSRHIRGAAPEELLVANLDNKAYVDIVYDGDISNMAQRFAEYYEAATRIRQARERQRQQDQARVSKGMLRQANFLRKIFDAAAVHLAN